MKLIFGANLPIPSNNMTQFISSRNRSCVKFPNIRILSQHISVDSGTKLGERALKNVRPLVPSTAPPDFGPVSSLCRSARYTILGWHCEGIRDHLKSTSQSVLQKHTCRSQHVACQKHTFFDQKSTTHKWPTFRKLTIFGSVL